MIQYWFCSFAGPFWPLYCKAEVSALDISPHICPSRFCDWGAAPSPASQRALPVSGSTQCNLYVYFQNKDETFSKVPKWFKMINKINSHIGKPTRIIAQRPIWGYPFTCKEQNHHIPLAADSWHCGNAWELCNWNPLSLFWACKIELMSWASYVIPPSPEFPTPAWNPASWQPDIQYWLG